MPKKEKTLLFFGDLAPKYLAGTSIAARINLDILARHFSISQVEENDAWGAESPSVVRKAVTTLSHVAKVYSLCKKEKPDIFYTHLPSSPLGVFKIAMLNLAVQLSSDSEIVLHLHRGDFHRNHAQSQLLRLFTKAVVRQTDLLFALSAKHKETLAGIIPSEKVRVLSNTIEQHPAVQPQKTKGTSFVYISNYILEKGILDLLEAFSRLQEQYPDISLDTYGNTLSPSFMETIKAYDNGNSIRIHGKIEGVEKFQVMANADCLVLPSWNEGQPMVLLEAMSLGTPIIASDVGFVSETLGDGYSFLFEAKNKSHLRDTILRFMETEDCPGQELQRRYESVFGIAPHADKLISAVQNVLTK